MPLRGYLAQQLDSIPDTVDDVILIINKLTRNFERFLVDLVGVETELVHGVLAPGMNNDVIVLQECHPFNYGVWSLVR